MAFNDYLRNLRANIDRVTTRLPYRQTDSKRWISVFGAVVRIAALTVLLTQTALIDYLLQAANDLKYNRYSTSHGCY